MPACHPCLPADTKQSCQLLKQACPLLPSPTLCSNGLLLPPVFANTTSQPLEPMQGCLIVNAWLTIAVGVLLPLFVQSRLEAAARQRFNERRRRQVAEQRRPTDWQPDAWRMEWTALYCYSFLTWLALDLLYGWPHWGLS